MSSPSETVNQVMQWLGGVLGVTLPTLPLKGWPQSIRNLWNFFTRGSLPNPEDPLPWCISVDGDWGGVLPPGSTLSLQNVTIRVSIPRPGPGSPC